MPYLHRLSRTRLLQGKCRTLLNTTVRQKSIQTPVMRILLCLVLILASSGCSLTSGDREEFGVSLRSWVDSPFSRKLTDLIDHIESGDKVAWQTFSSYTSAGLDGEYSETYSMACSELARRDPTIFLRKHLYGDERAIAVGKRAYGWIGTKGRHVMNWLHDSRLALATTEEERKKIQRYIAELHTVLDSIEPRYR